MPRSMELERRRSKKKRDDESKVHRLWKEGYNCKKSVRIGKKKDPMPRI